MNTILSPFYFLAPNRVWRTYLGGRTLDEIAGKDAPANSHFPEDWLLFTTRATNVGCEDIDEGVSQVVTDAGIVPLTTLIDAAPAALAAGTGRVGAMACFALARMHTTHPPN